MARNEWQPRINLSGFEPVDGGLSLADWRYYVKHCENFKGVFDEAI